MTSSRPDFDPELHSLLTQMPLNSQLTPDLLATLRQYPSTPPETFYGRRTVERQDVTVPAQDGAQLPLSIFSPVGAEAAPCIYWMHGGGMVMGDRLSQIDIPLEWLEEFGAVVVSVDYRLAPEVSGSTLVDDCYAGLLWIAEHADELGIDRDRIIIAGASAGGGLAAGITLMARDRRSVAIAAQILICPMLDHRGVTASSHQYSGDPGIWTREMNEFGWSSVLAGSTSPSSYLSPALAEDLSGLPVTYIDAGTAEVFRDEDVSYASRIWAAGGQADLHVWSGGFHGFDAVFPQAALSREARHTRTSWLSRTLIRLTPSRTDHPEPAYASR
ncbi:alpha/beta hydrolase [Kribbella sp. CA-293567]|uniref:alpha/beta hydrolase n=1 Tax=Kribbella sp. CA-293567 TaxID=3002436 RepID=UPI0022DD7767|nr:alpha/beta hydrolase [Kribbella sp. CA-293567]WBQ07635.1 alpha/beta hydrolase [Kribbella sp. CA-293567]